MSILDSKFNNLKNQSQIRSSLEMQRIHKKWLFQNFLGKWKAQTNEHENEQQFMIYGFDSDK